MKYFQCKTLLIGIFSLGLACTPVRVISSRKNTDVQFNHFQSYNFLDVSLKTQQIGEQSQQGIQLLKEAVDREMNKRGYLKSDNPDLWINIGIVTEDNVQTRRTDIREAPVYIGQRRYSWQSKEVEVGRYRVGTVSIDVIDSGKNQQIWEGVVQGILTTC